ncbi:unnamed protein product [Caenorhabditis brenneri]
MSAKDAIEQRLRAIGAPRDSQFNNNEPLRMQWNKSLEKFSNQIEDYYHRNKQSKEEFAQKLTILKEIQEYLIKQVFNKPIKGIQYDIKAVVPFGSSASGLGMKGGDLDLIVCVHPPLSWRRTDEIEERTNDILALILERIESGEMLGHRTFEDMEHRARTRVPIVTGTVDGIDLDISISMTQLVCAQYLSSKYIDAYGKYDSKFLHLAAFAKAWQKTKKTEYNEQYFKKVFPNSCSVVLLVIFFMKHYKLLPNINVKHKKKIGEDYVTWAMVNQGENGAFGVPNEEVKRWKESNYCDVNVGTLFFLFVDFYANVVDFQNQKLIIESGQFEQKTRKINRIIIVDVVDKHNTAESVTEAGILKLVLKKAANIIRDSSSEKIMNTLINEPLPDLSSFTARELVNIRSRNKAYCFWPFGH